MRDLCITLAVAALVAWALLRPRRPRVPVDRTPEIDEFNRRLARRLAEGRS
ncbi:MAG: hypothetical protein ACK52I_05550 [Pseudomonadota bacterium]|jgi:hypothetical protein